MCKQALVLLSWALSFVHHPYRQKPVCEPCDDTLVVMWPLQEADNRRFQLSHAAPEVHGEAVVASNVQTALGLLKTTNMLYVLQQQNIW